MTPVYQRTATDCFRCCVASVLDLAYEDVPDAKYGTWLEDLRAWAAGRGLIVEWETDPADVLPTEICVMGTEWNGDSERSLHGHSVVSRGPTEIIHDPRVGGSKSYGASMFWIRFKEKR